MKEESLSDKEWESVLPSGLIEKIYFKKDVKEFIKKLKKELKTDLTGCFTSQKQCDEWNKDTNRIIDELAGDKLI